jgi:hypothetical protein
MLAYLQRRCYTEDECRVWAGYKDKRHGGYVTWRGQRHTPRRLLLELLGRRVGKRTIYATCGRNDCMNPDHLRIGSHGDALRNAARLGAWPVGAQRAVISAVSVASRARLGIREARDVMDARARGETLEAIGRRYGVTASAVGHAINRWSQAGMYWPTCAPEQAQRQAA